MKFLFSLIVFAGLATAVRAQETEDKTSAKQPVKIVGSYAGEVTATRLQLRAGPSTSYQTVASLERGERVIVLGARGADGFIEVEVPQGYHAWVFGSFLAPRKDGTGEVLTDRLLVRPRANTTYHHLKGRLNKGEMLEVVGKQQTAEGLWYKVVVPRRFPLYANADFLKNIGPAKLAEPKKDKTPAKAGEPTTEDRQFESLAKAVLVELPKANSTHAIEPLRRAVMEIDPRSLNLANRGRRIELLSKILTQERTLAVKELTEREREISSDLEKKLAEIEARYQERLRKLREDRRTKPRYIATGIVQHHPDLLGRYPSYRLEQGKRMRYYLIATDFDLQKFAGKRVGVIGLTDPESGTGYETIIVKRIEILGNK